MTAIGRCDMTAAFVVRCTQPQALDVCG